MCSEFAVDLNINFRQPHSCLISNKNQMTKTPLIIFTVIINVALLSCEPQKSAQELINEAANEECCGNGSEIPPPPPPPPDDDKDNSGN
jgi:hypothetical protein